MNMKRLQCCQYPSWISCRTITCTNGSKVNIQSLLNTCRTITTTGSSSVIIIILLRYICVLPIWLEVVVNVRMTRFVYNSLLYSHVIHDDFVFY